MSRVVSLVLVGLMLGLTASSAMNAGLVSAGSTTLQSSGSAYSKFWELLNREASLVVELNETVNTTIVQELVETSREGELNAANISALIWKYWVYSYYDLPVTMRLHLVGLMDNNYQGYNYTIRSHVVVKTSNTVYGAVFLDIANGVTFAKGMVSTAKFTAGVLDALIHNKEIVIKTSTKISSRVSAARVLFKNFVIPGVWQIIIHYGDLKQIFGGD